MAKRVYQVLELELQDGTVVELRPLVIKKMRAFMKEMKGLNDLGSGTDLSDIDEKQFDLLVNLVGICLESQLKDGKTTKVWKEYLEDNLDVETINRIIKHCTGVDFSGSQDDEDPNLMAPLDEEELGTA